MLSIIKCIALNGVEGFIVEVQVDVSNGIPRWDIIGLPDASIKESKERVKSSIKNSGYEIPSKKITINLAPATIKKCGSTFDLSIAIAIITANKNIGLLKETIFIGELGLDGKLIPVKGVLPICIEARKKGFKRIIVPKLNQDEACIVENIEVIPAESLAQVIDFVFGRKKMIPIKKSINTLQNKVNKYDIDFCDIKGQRSVKRALEIAASGGHNCLMIGSPGVGKTMIAKRLPTILPELTFNESLEVTKIHSIAGTILKRVPLIVNRPFISPHYSISKSAFVGGNKDARPGEISLAHYGVLFLDELPEFERQTIEVLRGPMEEKRILINRSGGKVMYPCNFMLVASMNPCPCGFFGSEKKCRCSPNAIQKYLNKISGPLLDRIDIQVEVSPVKFENLKSNQKEEPSETIRKRVEKTRAIQRARYNKEKFSTNSELLPSFLNKYCRLDDKCKSVMEEYFKNYNLSVRSYNKIITVARTIADMDESSNIKEKHILEAIQYRSLDKKFY